MATQLVVQWTNERLGGPSRGTSPYENTAAVHSEQLTIWQFTVPFPETSRNLSTVKSCFPRDLSSLLLHLLQIHVVQKVVGGLDHELAVLQDLWI